MTEFSPKKCAINIGAVFIFVFFYDMLVHGYVLKSMYIETAHLWRPMEEMQALMPMCFFYHFAISALFVALYSRWCGSSVACFTADKKKIKSKGKDKESCVFTDGTNFGLTIGLLMGVMMASGYIHMPIPASLAISWFIAGLVQGLGIGIVLSLVNHNCSSEK